MGERAAAESRPARGDGGDSYPRRLSPETSGQRAGKGETGIPCGHGQSPLRCRRLHGAPPAHPQHEVRTPDRPMASAQPYRALWHDGHRKHCGSPAQFRTAGLSRSGAPGRCGPLRQARGGPASEGTHPCRGAQNRLHRHPRGPAVLLLARNRGTAGRLPARQPAELLPLVVHA